MVPYIHYITHTFFCVLPYALDQKQQQNKHWTVVHGREKENESNLWKQNSNSWPAAGNHTELNF